MKKMNARLLSALFSALLLTSTISFAWTLEEDDNGIKVFTQEIEGSDFKAFKGEMNAQAQLDEVLDIIRDVESMDEWLHECVASQIMEKTSDEELIVYQETSAPWPVTDRNFVLKMKVHRAEDGLSAKINFSALVEPEVANDDCVRVTELTGSWTLTQTSDSNVHVVYQTSADPAGDVPSWLANAFVVDQPYNTLLNLRNRVETKRHEVE
ncbi:hypothetical protein A3758_13600 [Oleiphilus sp. HI0118]|jgi:hypothetical protein|nr:hypothetical protein A3758_13600 [Oleiphilus sp. HI0118]